MVSFNSPYNRQVLNLWFEVMGYADADFNVLPQGMRDCAAWATCLRAVDDGRIDNPTNGIAGSALERDYHGYVGENVHKWSVVEATEAVVDWSRADTVESQFAAVAPTRTTRALHLVIGQDAYLPTWAETELAATPGSILDLIGARVDQIKAKYPAADPFYRIDVVNEITNSDTATSVAAARGWRTTANSFRTASLDATTLATVLGNNAEKWIWDAFELTKIAFPNARLAWTDFAQELVMSPAAASFPILHSPWGVSPFLTDNSTAGNLHRINRMKYEVWRALAAGTPIDVVGYQLHLSPVAPPEFYALRASLHDWNRMGVTPAITEFNVVNTGALTTKVPPHLGTAPNLKIDRYGAWVANAYLREFLTHSPLEEITFWSIASNLDTAQTASREGLDYPIRIATMLALQEAVAPGSRTLKRGAMTDMQFSYPPWVSIGGATLAFSSRRCAVTAAGSLQVPWTWYSDTWMARPISATHLILSAVFYIDANVTDNTVLMGYGNGDSGTPTNTVKILVMANRNIVIEVRVASAVVLSEVLGTAALDTLSRVAVRINGTAVEGVLNGGAVQPFTAGGSFGDQTTVYFLSNPAGDGTHAQLSSPYFEIQHGADHPADADLIALGTYVIRGCSLGIYDGTLGWA